MALMLVSSDINSANHNYPTNYNEPVYVAGSFPDTAPNNTCTGPGGLPGIGDVLQPAGRSSRRAASSSSASSARHRRHPDGAADDHELLPQLEPDPVRRQGRHRPDGHDRAPRTPARRRGWPGCWSPTRAAPSPAAQFPAGLSGNETRQLLTMTAEDVLPAEHRRRSACPTRRTPGWDPHFGYGRVEHGRGDGPDPAEAGQPIPRVALRNRRTCIPPEAQIDAPGLVLADRRRPGARRPALQIRGHAAAPHAGERRRLERPVRVRPGRARTRASRPIPGASGTGPVERRPGHALEVAARRTSPTNCNGEVVERRRAARRRGRRRRLARRPLPEPRPRAPRLPDPPDRRTRRLTRPTSAATARRSSPTATTATSPAGRGRSAPAPPPPRYVTGSGGETSPRLYDVDGDNKLDVLLATSSGELYALHSDGTPVAELQRRTAR